MLDKKINKKRLYWILQSFGWGLFFVTYTSLAVAFIGPKWQIFASYANTVIFGIIITEFYRRWIKKHEWLSLSLSILTRNVLLTSMFIAAIWVAIVLPINENLFYLEDPNDQQLGPVATYFAIWFQFVLIIVGWSLIYFVFQFFINFKRSEVEKWKLEAAVKDAELIALKSQINPHFIFNSLNNIRALVIEDPSKARDMITHLSDLLRYSVQFNNKEKVCIEDEMEIVKNYLNLESIQYEDRLKYMIDIEPETLEHKIPPMAVQILVENAIKHGISELPKGGEIRISTQCKENTLIVEVRNTGRLHNAVKGTGIGVKNVSERLGLLFGKLSTFTLENTSDNMVSAKFIIPIS